MVVFTFPQGSASTGKDEIALRLGHMSASGWNTKIKVLFELSILNI